ncbi:hypothetical protein LXL04_007427 [Taraxacum kok-saghyz]
MRLLVMEELLKRLYLVQYANKRKHRGVMSPSFAICNQRNTNSHTLLATLHREKMCTPFSGSTPQIGHMMSFISIPLFESAILVGILSNNNLQMRILTLPGSNLHHLVLVPPAGKTFFGNRKSPVRANIPPPPIFTIGPSNLINKLEHPIKLIKRPVCRQWPLPSPPPTRRTPSFNNPSIPIHLQHSQPRKLSGERYNQRRSAVGRHKSAMGRVTQFTVENNSNGQTMNNSMLVSATIKENHRLEVYSKEMIHAQRTWVEGDARWNDLLESHFVSFPFQMKAITPNFRSCSCRPTGKRSTSNLFKQRNQVTNPSRYRHNDLRPEKKRTMMGKGTKEPIWSVGKLKRSMANEMVPEGEHSDPGGELRMSWFNFWSSSFEEPAAPMMRATKSMSKANGTRGFDNSLIILSVFVGIRIESFSVSKKNSEFFFWGNIKGPPAFEDAKIELVENLEDKNPIEEKFMSTEPSECSITYVKVYSFIKAVSNSDNYFPNAHNVALIPKVDMKSGFWQIQLHEVDKYKTINSRDRKSGRNLFENSKLLEHFLSQMA